MLNQKKLFAQNAIIEDYSEVSDPIPSNIRCVRFKCKHDLARALAKMATRYPTVYQNAGDPGCITFVDPAQPRVRRRQIYILNTEYAVNNELQGAIQQLIQF